MKKSINATELPISGSTSLAAKKVAEQTLPTGTAAIGSCGLASVYPNLSIVQQGIEENKNNNTTFLLLSVKKRTLPVSEEIAREELMAAISTGRQL
ncbi:hypothetical protein BOO24_16215 [Vibrio navarrensis]|uniref:prephenate dehydratase domain-containing protein n=1 Tax=Vibrio navarrensis TaxID=29495 RepID=UPI00186A4089|nr:prephenate dehydratase domain-containing protein [Vibrio navarrensis]MBE4593878.1 hypothetical protein [Vibrio navarrensis]